MQSVLSSLCLPDGSIIFVGGFRSLMAFIIHGAVPIYRQCRGESEVDV